MMEIGKGSDPVQVFISYSLTKRRRHASSFYLQKSTVKYTIYFKI